MANWRAFQGQQWKFTGGLQQVAGKQWFNHKFHNKGHIRINIANLGWDRAFAKLTEIPKSVQISLRSATTKNTKEVWELARRNVPHFLETNRLYNSIAIVDVKQRGADGWMTTVEADMPYAHFVEMGVHTWGADFGARQRAMGFQHQGAHYLRRASEEYAPQAHADFNKAVQHGINRAISVAKRGYSREKLDFNTATSRKAFSFAKRAGNIINSSSSGSVPPLTMEMLGL